MCGVLFPFVQLICRQYIIIHVDCILGQWNTTDPVRDSVDIGLDDKAKRCTVQPFHSRSLKF